MFRTAAIAAIASCISGAASPIGAQFLGISAMSASPVAVTAPHVQVVGQPAKYRLRLARAGDGLFHAPLWINGQRTSLIVDTGATVTVLTAADAARLGVAPRPASGGATLRTAGGGSPMRWATVKSLRFAGRDLVDLEVAIVEHGLDHSLLGQDVLSAGGVLRLEGEAMEIS